MNVRSRISQNQDILNYYSKKIIKRLDEHISLSEHELWTELINNVWYVVSEHLYVRMDESLYGDLDFLSTWFSSRLEG